MTKTKTSKPVRCETCNITLNSEQQAKQHFTGKSHLKKLRQLNAPADEKEKKKSAGGESSEKKKLEKGDGKKIDGDDDGESSSEKPCSDSTDDAVSSSVSKTKKNAASSSEKYTTTAAPPAGVTETASSESSTRAVSTNQSGKFLQCYTENFYSAKMLGYSRAEWCIKTRNIGKYQVRLEIHICGTKDGELGFKIPTSNLVLIT